MTIAAGLESKCELRSNSMGQSYGNREINAHQTANLADHFGFFRSQKRQHQRSSRELLVSSSSVLFCQLESLRKDEEKSEAINGQDLCDVQERRVTVSRYNRRPVKAIKHVRCRFWLSEWQRKIVGKFNQISAFIARLELTQNSDDYEN